MSIHSHRLLPALLLLVSGCSFLDLLDSGYDYTVEDPCTIDGDEPATVAGDWSLTGRGERTACSLDNLNTPRFDIASQGRLQIAQDGTQLELINDREGFSLYGSVEGICVDFTTTEAHSDITFDWTGTVENNIVTGTFTGYGPSACLSEGDFTLIIE